MRKTFFTVLIITGAVTLVSGYTLLTTRKTPPVATFAKTDKKAGLVAGFPQMPVYNNARIENSYIKKERNLVGYEANWLTTDPVYVVMKWYMKELGRAAWQLVTPPEDPAADSEQYSVWKKGNKVLILNVEQEVRAETEIHAEFPLQKP